MKNYINFKIIVTLFTWFFILQGCAQNNIDREPYAAGKFYEADSAKLVKILKTLFEKAKNHNLKNVLAIISPHAGFMYSGEVAATAYKQINPDKEFDNIFIIGSSHTMYIDGASIYSVGDYLTPLGKVKVNKQLALELINQNRYISYIPEAHTHEHIIENQLPFIQYYFNKQVKIVPVIIGTGNEKILKSIANTLKPYLKKNNLFVISSDFSHYPLYKDAQKADSTTANAIITNNPEKFIEALKINASKGYPGLVTSACSRTSILTLLYITQNIKDVKYIPLMYMNSGDIPTGDKSRVVGYFALALVENNENEVKDFLNDNDKKSLLRIARTTIESYLKNGKVPEIDTTKLSPALKLHTGAFVTLNKNHRLRGCIGKFIADEPLYKVVQDMAIAAATQDPRFTPVIPVEMDKTNIEISVLTPLKKIKSIDEIQLGRDGIYIVKGYNSGTFLPQVATETKWDKEEFLGHCARDKAGLDWYGWKDADIYTYQAIVFSESDYKNK
jgi:AmmeMemoRadiSam system protein B/AmmeMemoRadiSam system protein A